MAPSSARQTPSVDSQPVSVSPSNKGAGSSAKAVLEAAARMRRLRLIILEAVRRVVLLMVREL